MRFKTRQFQDRVLILIWTLPLSLLLTLALGLHFVSFKVAPIVNLHAESGFSVHHFLSLKCTCSQKLIAHLLERRQINQTREVVHLIHADESIVRKLVASGYSVEPVSEEAAVSQFHLQALPQLVVLRDAKIIYQGGYALDQQHTVAYEDLRIIEAARAQQAVDSFPVFGCANGQLAKSSFDLANLKYGTN